MTELTERRSIESVLLLVTDPITVRVYDVREFCRNDWRRVLYLEVHLEEDHIIRIHIQFDKRLASGTGLADARIVMPSHHPRSSGFSPRSRRKT